MDEAAREAFLDDLAQFPVVQSAPDVLPDETTIHQFTQHITGSKSPDAQLQKTIASSAPVSDTKVAARGTRPSLWIGLTGVIVAAVGLIVGLQSGTSSEADPPAPTTTATAPSSEAVSTAQDTPTMPSADAIVHAPSDAVPEKQTRPKRVVLDRPRPAWPSGYEVAWTGNAAAAGTISVALPTPRPAIHIPMNALWQADRNGQGLYVDTISARLRLGGNDIATPRNEAVRDDGRMRLKLPPLPMVARYQVDVTIRVADGTTSTLSLTYDAATGTLTTR